eukprot:TRINITY_DN13238_c0_g1::TRINITY_DN13238_c0_g1_i1::g.12635::m.12635 TRINITY_DN13238_c0_g1::TRINITY_DN13238_c0_g1_i1::g.12635  ORF type:complete len:204 (+),score=10.84,APG6/PF04111.7/0.00047,DUF342/PF03961.8/0.0079,DUF4600/PF15372.1/0.06,Peptidase_S46/PF10459.4/0.065,bZIP_1/PF00170.16/0.071,bZIP_1/PF00170.16/1.7e+02,SAMP/PF05924.6/0.21,SAMP/PF05924.6/1.8e+03,Phage_GP20/PF06810.6/0.18,IncA/PF04156.9/0.42,Mto2_bdg/PF12808.2/0.12,Mto2_bdg/PF12808.2/2.8e+03,GAS/PF13851.1/23,GAS/PF13851.1/0.22,ORF6C/PF
MNENVHHPERIVSALERSHEMHHEETEALRNCLISALSHSPSVNADHKACDERFSALNEENESLRSQILAIEKSLKSMKNTETPSDPDDLLKRLESELAQEKTAKEAAELRVKAVEDEMRALEEFSSKLMNQHEKQVDSTHYDKAFHIDRRVVAKLFIKYFEKRGTDGEAEVLQMLASMIGLTEEEMEFVGLVTPNRGWGWFS